MEVVPDDIRIVSLRSENFMRLRAIELTPGGQGGCTVVTGPNAAGKSCTLRSLAAALAGDRPLNPIRDGEEKAIIIVETTQFVVKLTYRDPEDASKYTLVIKSLDGSITYGSPGAILKEALGGCMLDPTELLRAHPDEQLQMLCDIAGVNVTSYTEDYEQTFGERATANRDVKRLEHHRASLAAPPSDLPKKEQDTKELTELRDELSDKCTAKTNAEQMTSQAKTLVNQKISRCDEIEMELVTARMALLKAQEAADVAVEAEKKFPADVAEQLKQVQSEIDEAQTKNLEIVKAADYMRTSADLATATKLAEKLTKRLDKIKSDKQAALAAATLPVDGITLTEDGVLYNGQPLDGASSAEKMSFWRFG
jgi:DNA repair ATPase RecN